jgi:molybdopterin molybdotransferase
MLSVDQARERIVASVLALGDEAVALAEAHGRVLADAIAAEEPVPAFANSGMDGHAVRAGDVAQATRSARCPCA